MRIILAAAALAALTLCGCDINTGTPKTAKVECNCAQPQQAATTPPPGDDTGPVPPEHHHWHHRGYAQAYRAGRYYHWRREYAEIPVQTYDYHSESHSYSTETDADGGEAYMGDSGYHRDGLYRASAHGWVDGYGRGHDGEAGDAAHYDATTSDRTRLQPWRGYDVDCPDNDPRARR